MNKDELMTVAKSIVLSNEGVEFNSVLKLEKAHILIASLIYSLGFERVIMNVNDSNVVFNVPIGSNDDEVLCFDSEKKVTSGKLSGDLESTYNLVQAIETTLNKAMLYPKEIRDKVVENTISDIGVSKERFNLVLRNWKTY